MFRLKIQTIVATFFLSLLYSVSDAQKGLENIIVEKYYISDAHDFEASKGTLPVGSVTYRIYVDMKPGYKFQAAYGIPGHEMQIATTTFFYNNEQYGGITANDVPWKSLANNTVMLDSWLSVGAASSAHYGVLKDDDSEDKTIVNADGILQNQDKNAGIPLKRRDGLRDGSIQLAVAYYGLDSIKLNLFNNKNNQKKGQVFSSDNGSWASLVGAVGVDSSNKVLIAQITTDGEFSFELNIQIGTPDGGVENYVAENPVGKEIQFPGLNYPLKESKPEPKRH